MKKYGKAFIVAAVNGVAAFAISYFIGYRKLLSEQPRSDGTLPAQFTSFPPEAAAIMAFVWAVAFFVLGFVATAVYQRLSIRFSQTQKTAL